MKEAFKSLSRRVAGEEIATDGIFSKILVIISPTLVYYVVNFVVLYITVFLSKLLANESTSVARTMTEYSRTISIVVTVISMVLAVLLFVPSIVNDRPIIVKRKESFNWITTVLLLGISSSLFLNILFSVTGFTATSKRAMEVSSSQFGMPLAVGILYYGLFTPLFEEIIFRLLIYNRMRRELGVVLSLTLCPLLFGLYHGNVVQGVYGFIMGFLICWVYERFGSFIYPYLLHSVANTFIYIVISVGNFKNNVTNKFALFLSGVIMVIAIVRLIKPAESREEKV